MDKTWDYDMHSTVILTLVVLGGRRVTCDGPTGGTNRTKNAKLKHTQLWELRMVV